MAVLTPMRAKVLERRAGSEAAPPMEAGRTRVDLFLDRVARWSACDGDRDLQRSHRGVVRGMSERMERA
jgi:hypothetical protein